MIEVWLKGEITALLEDIKKDTYYRRYLDSMKEDGGPGSGNWGHEGNPPNRGGSKPGGGLQNRMGTGKVGYTSFAKAKKESMERRIKYNKATIKESPPGTKITLFNKYGNKYDTIIINKNGDPVSGKTGKKVSYADLLKNCTKMAVPLPESERAEYQNLRKTPQKVVNGKDISSSYDGRTDIKSVVKAQGFDGRPKLVSKEEFDKAVKESNFIAQRAYTGSSPEILDLYKDQLYNGDWYVECSVGGAQYGQGMYCAASYNGELTEGIKTEMNHYKDLNEWRAKDGGPKPVSTVETLTLDPSAKIIEYGDLKKLYDGITDKSTRRKMINDYVDDYIEKTVAKHKGKEDSVKQLLTAYKDFDEATDRDDRQQKGEKFLEIKKSSGIMQQNRCVQKWTRRCLTHIR